MMQTSVKNIALLTGRGGSMSIKDKNVMPVLGRPLMMYPYIAAQQAKYIDDIYLSTDGEKLKEIAESNGIKIINRPPELALETSQHVECIHHALNHLKERGIQVNILVVLLCNVATHDVGAIDAAIEFLSKNPEYDSCVAVTEMRENHPAIAKKTIANSTPLQKSFETPVHYLTPFLEDDAPLSRESMRPCYFLTHSFWALRVASLEKTDGQPPWDFMGKKIAGLKMEHGRDIHDFEDTAFVECWLQMRGWTPFDGPYTP